MADLVMRKLCLRPDLQLIGEADRERVHAINERLKKSAGQLLRTIDRGTQQLVLLIPTKETVYADLMDGAGRLNGNYARLVEMESRARAQVKAWCAEKHLKCTDALPDLRSAVARRERIYPSSTESHPNAAGYRVLATTVQRALQN